VQTPVIYARTEKSCPKPNPHRENSACIYAFYTRWELCHHIEIIDSSTKKLHSHHRGILHLFSAHNNGGQLRLGP
jgi:hypothetical protein